MSSLAPAAGNAATETDEQRRRRQQSQQQQAPAGTRNTIPPESGGLSEEEIRGQAVDPQPRGEPQTFSVTQPRSQQVLPPALGADNRGVSDSPLVSGFSSLIHGGARNEFQAAPFQFDESAFDMPSHRQFQSDINAARGRQAPLINVGDTQQSNVTDAMAAGIDRRRLDVRQRGEGDALGLIEQRATGAAPSAAELQMQRGLEQAQAAAMAQAASQPGVSAGLALRGAQQAGRQAMLDVNQQQAILRAQEQAQAQDALLAGRQQQVGTELAIAGQEADFQQQVSLQNAQAANEISAQNADRIQQIMLANQNAGLTTQQQNDQLVQFFTQAGLDLATARMQAQMELERLRGQQFQVAQALNAQTTASNVAARQREEALLPMLLGTGLGAAAGFAIGGPAGAAVGAGIGNRAAGGV